LAHCDVVVVHGDFNLGNVIVAPSNRPQSARIVHIVPFQLEMKPSIGVPIGA